MSDLIRREDAVAAATSCPDSHWGPWIAERIRALPAVQPPAQCCMCGKTGLSTVEGDGGPECELSDGRWVCSRECWDRAVQPGKEVMPDVPNGAPNAPDAAPASTADAGGGATREEVAEALWRADQYQGQIRFSFADAEIYIRNHHWLKLADVAIKTIKGESHE